MKFRPPRIGRAVTANILISSFIIMTSVGAFYIDVSAGFITLGATSGLIGFILGME